MRKIEKLELRKIVEPTDILKKKQMGNLWGGIEFCCAWECTVDQYGNVGGYYGEGSSYEECWTNAEEFCTFPDYGIRIKPC